jgi:hypothetical protein
MPNMFILNPYANRWKAGRRKDEALATLRVHVELRLAEGPGHASVVANGVSMQGGQMTGVARAGLVPRIVRLCVVYLAVTLGMLLNPALRRMDTAPWTVATP